MQIILRDALRLKNRILQKKTHAMKLIQSENSKLVGGKRKCDVPKTMQEYNDLVSLLVELKTAISNANVGIRKDLELMAEIRSTIKDLKAIPTGDGLVEDAHRWNSGEPRERESALSQETLDKLVMIAEADLDRIQKRIGEHNNKTTIDINICKELEDAVWIHSVIS